MDSKIKIDQITTISNTLEFDGTTTRWFHIQDKILKDMSSDQITNWIKKAKALIKKPSITKMNNKFQ